MILILPGCGRGKGYTEEDFTNNYSASDFVTTNAYSGMWLDARAGINRKELYVCRADNVPDDVYQLVVEGLEKIIDEAGRSVSVVQEEIGLPTCYRSPDWYQTETMTDRQRMHGLQANATSIIELLRSHDDRNDHFVVLITAADLTTGEIGNNFIFGLSWYPYIVVSARRFLDWGVTREGGYPEETYRQAVSMLAAHEFGHYLDLVQRNFNSYRNTGTLVDNHCMGESGMCLMQQSNVDAPGCIDALERTYRVFSREHWLCPDCAAELYYRRQALEEEGYEW